MVLSKRALLKARPRSKQVIKAWRKLAGQLKAQSKIFRNKAMLLLNTYYPACSLNTLARWGSIEKFEGASFPSEAFEVFTDALFIS